MFNNQFREDVKFNNYQKVCNRNLKLLRRLDHVNNENLSLTEKVKELNNSLNDLDLELNNLESNFKCLNKPLISVNCSLQVISFLTLLFCSLFNNCLWLMNKIKGINLNIKGNL